MPTNYAVTAFVPTANTVSDLNGLSRNFGGRPKGTINSVNSMDCDNIKVSDDAADGLIAIAIDAGNPTTFAEDTAGGLIAAIDADGLMNCTDKSSSDDAADGLIATPINTDGFITNPIYSTENADTNVLDYDIGGLMTLMF